MAFDWERGFRARFLAQNGIYSFPKSHHIKSKFNITITEFQLFIVGLLLSASIHSLLSYKLTCLVLFYLGAMHMILRTNCDKIFHYNLLLTSLFFATVVERSLSLDFVAVLINAIYLSASTILGVFGIFNFKNLTDSPFIIYMITYSNVISILIGMLLFMCLYFCVLGLYWLILVNIFTILSLFIHKLSTLRFQPSCATNPSRENRLFFSLYSEKTKYRRLVAIFKNISYFFIRLFTILLFIPSLAFSSVMLTDTNPSLNFDFLKIDKSYILTDCLITTNLLITCFAILFVSLELVNFCIYSPLIGDKLTNNYRICGYKDDSIYKIILERSLTTSKADDANRTNDNNANGYVLVSTISERILKYLDSTSMDEEIRYYNMFYWGKLFNELAVNLDLTINVQSTHMEEMRRIVRIEYLRVQREKDLMGLEPSDRYPPPYRSISIQPVGSANAELTRFSSIPHPLELPPLECIVPKPNKYMYKGIIERTKEEWERLDGDEDTELHSFNYKYPTVDEKLPYHANYRPEPIDLTKIIEDESQMELPLSQSPSHAWDLFINNLAGDDPFRIDEITKLDNDFNETQFLDEYINISQYQFDDESICNEMSNRLTYQPPAQVRPFTLILGKPNIYPSRAEYLKAELPIKFTRQPATVSPKISAVPMLHHEYQQPSEKINNNRKMYLINNPLQPRIGKSGGTGESTLFGESGSVPEGQIVEQVDSNRLSQYSDDSTEATPNNPLSPSIVPRKLSQLSCDAYFSDIDDELSPIKSNITASIDSYSDNRVIRTARFGNDSTCPSQASSIEQIFL